MQYLELLLMLIGSHFICDYVLQTDAIATGKNRLLDPAKFGVNWYYWMTSHAVTHGFGVGIITGPELRVVPVKKVKEPSHAVNTDPNNVSNIR